MIDREFMEIELLPHQMAELTEIAALTGRGTDELVREAVDQLLTENEWHRQQARVGVEQIGRGEFITEDEMAQRLERLLSR